MNDYITPIHFGIQDSVTVALYQYDKGQVLQFDEVEEFAEVQFQNGAIKLVHNSQIEVPDALLTETEHFDAWVQVIGVNNETTIKRIHFRIIERGKKDNYIEPEDIPTFREEVQAILNSAKEIADSAKESADSAKESADSVRETVETAQSVANEAKSISKEALQLIDGVSDSAEEAKQAKEQAVAAATSAGNYANSASAYAGSANHASTSAKQSENLAGESANAAQNAAIEASTFSSSAKGYADQAKEAAKNAQDVSLEADEIASEARTIASSAEAKANTAIENSGSAVAIATDARESAKKAQAAASAAESSAQAAAESANAAKDSSTESRNFSLEAQRAANAASMAASSANDKADMAVSTAQSVRNDANAGKFNGQKGEPFRYEDFTPEQLETLKGKDGYTPERGKDYWTPTDVGTINSYVDSVVTPIRDEVGAFENEIVQISDTQPTGSRNRVWITTEETEHELVEVADLESAIAVETAAREQSVAQLNEDLALQADKLNALIKLSEGQIYDEKSVTEESYTETIGNGCYWGSVDNIGGKSIVFNQFIDESTITINPYYDKTLTDGIYTLTARIQGNRFQKDISFTNGDVILAIAEVKAGDNNDIHFVTYSYSNPLTVIAQDFNSSTNWKKIFGIYKMEYSGKLLTQFYCYANEYPSTFQYKKDSFQVFNLTQMGYPDIKTLSEFEALFPEPYYPYTEPEIVSAEVDEVRVHGTNLYNGGNIIAPTDAAYYVQITTEPLGRLLKEHRGETLYLSWDYIGTSEGAFDTIAIIDGSTTTYLRQGLRAIPNMSDDALLFCYYGNGNEAGKSYNNILVSKGQASYYPYHEPQIIPMPHSLPMRSAGTVHDEIDFERKVHIQRIGVVDLGTLNWQKYSNTTNTFVVTGFSLKNNILCSKYSRIAWSDVDKANGVFPNATYSQIIITDLSYTVTGDFKTAMSGVMLYYELAEPIETDISAYLADFPEWFETEPNGSIEYHHSLADDGMLIPVPHTATYVRKLNEV